MLKAVIFDMDGVLIDSEPLHWQIVKDVLATYGLELPSNYDHNFIGSTTLHTFECIAEEFHLSVSPIELQEAYFPRLKQAVKQQGYPPILGVKPLLMDLKKHHLQLAVASSSTLEEIKYNINDCGMEEFFDVLVSGTDLPNPKPDPEIFLKAAELLQVSPSECIVIEDSTNGILSALSASMSVIGYQNPHSGNQDLSKADFLIEGFEEMDYSYILRIYQRSHNEPVVIAETARLIIRELSVENIRTMYQIHQSPEIKEFVQEMQDFLEIEVQKHKSYIKQVYHFYGYGLWGVFSKENGSLIGKCGIENKIVDGKPEIELEYLLDHNHWGFGYAVECTYSVLRYAFETLHMKRIVAVIDQRNRRSVKVAERLGMAVEKEFIHKDRPCYLFYITETMFSR